MEILTTVNLSDNSQLDVILDRFDAAWARGTTPEIREFVPDEGADLETRRSVVLELMAIDL